MMPMLILLLAGCGGISASRSISPLDFFLPGLLRADPQPQQPPQPGEKQLPPDTIAKPEPVTQLAMAQ